MSSPLQCPYDASKYKDTKPSQIKAHYAKCHTAHTKVPCDKCSEVFRDKSSKNRHMKELHGGAEWVCPMCSKKFPRKRNLDAHVVKHAAPICSVCNISFKLRKELLAHVRAFHRGDGGNEGSDEGADAGSESGEEAGNLRPKAMDTTLVMKQIAAQIKATQAELSGLKRAKASMQHGDTKRQRTEAVRELTQAEVVMKATEAALAAKAFNSMQAHQTALALRTAQVAQVYQAAKAAQAARYSLDQKKVVKRPKVTKVTPLASTDAQKPPLPEPLAELPAEPLVNIASPVPTETLRESSSPVKPKEVQESEDLQEIRAIQAAASVDARTSSYAWSESWSDPWKDPWKAALFNPFAQEPTQNPWLIPTTEEKPTEKSEALAPNGGVPGWSCFPQDAFPLFSSATWGSDPFCLSQY